MENADQHPRRRTSSFSRLFKKLKRIRKSKHHTPAPKLKTTRVSTLQAALSKAKPGQTIFVKPGRYAEDLTVDKPVSITGLGEHGQVVLASSTGPYTVTVASRDVQFNNLRLERIASMSRLETQIALMMEQVAICCRVKKGSLLMTECTVQCGLYDDREGTATSGSTERGVQDCIVVSPGGCLTLDHTEVRGGLHAVRITSGACGHIEHCKLIGHSAEALLVEENGQVHACCNEITDSLAGALLKQGGPAVVFKRNMVQRCAVGLIAKSKDLVVEKNDFVDNSTIGVYVINGCSVTLRNNTIKKNRNGVVADGGHAVVESNTITNNKRCGVKVKQCAEVSLVRNTISFNKRGVRVHLGSADVRHNDVVRNTYGMDLCSSQSRVQDNQIIGNAKYGLLVRGDSRDVVAENQVKGSACGVCVRSIQEPELKDNSISECKSYDYIRVTNSRSSPLPDDDDDDDD
eukprot:TRINITY_DN891_c1_g1_i1.p1 TRINITY_DN891_c1_g1~~TRINITY_DN891_c1_g1_i1.p1  ORF type:complete len:461 (-),score=98.04 TRINITY_DN891_c1_g1_i1:161-1543(-)